MALQLSKFCLPNLPSGAWRIGGSKGFVLTYGYLLIRQVCTPSLAKSASVGGGGGGAPNPSRLARIYFLLLFLHMINLQCCARLFSMRQCMLRVQTRSVILTTHTTYFYLLLFSNSWCSPSKRPTKILRRLLRQGTEISHFVWKLVLANARQPQQSFTSVVCGWKYWSSSYSLFYKKRTARILK